MTRPSPHNAIFAWQNCVTGTAPNNLAAETFDDALSGGPGWRGWVQPYNMATWLLGQEAVSRTAAGTEHRIVQAWDTAQPVDLVAVVGHNIVIADDSTIRVRVTTEDGEVDSGPLPAYPPAPLGYIPWGDSRFWGHLLVGPWDRRFVFVLDELVFATAVTIEITGAGQDGQALAIPIVYAGPSWQVGQNYDKGSGSGPHAVGDLQGADYGTPLAEADVAPRVWTGRFGHLTEGEVRARLAELLAHTGRGRLPFLALMEPGTDYGLMTQTLLAFLPEAPLVRKSTAVAGEYDLELELREWLA